MNKQDRQGVRTASDLERKYNLGSLQKSNNYNAEALSKVNQTMAQFMTEVNSKIENIEAGVVNMLLIYPVGSIYLSVNPIDPSTLFGGTWESKGQASLSTDITCYMWQRTN